MDETAEEDVRTSFLLSSQALLGIMTRTNQHLLMWFYFVNRKLEVQLPRFLLEKSYTFRDILQTLNIIRIFQDEAEIIEMGTIGPRLTQVTVCPSACLSVCLSDRLLNT